MIWDFRGLELIDNLKKGVLFLKVEGEGQSESHYKVLLLNFYYPLRNRNREVGSEEKIDAEVLNYMEMDW